MMIIEVKQKHIQKGKRKNNEKCPIALALRNRTSDSIEVHDSYVLIDEVRYELPKKATKFIRRFDKGVKRKKLKPFSFLFA